MLKFNLSNEMVAIIGTALGKQPYDTVAPVLSELQKQINAQLSSPKKKEKLPQPEEPTTFEKPAAGPSGV